MNFAKRFNLISIFLINKYFKYFFTTLFILVGIIWLTRIVKYIDYLTVNNMKVLDFSLLSLLLVPTLIDFLFPFIAVIALIFTFNNLIQKREIYIFKVSGLNNFYILKPLLYCFLILLFVHFILSFLIVPFSYNKIEIMKRDVASVLISGALNSGKFNSLDSNIVVFVDQKDKDSVYDNLIAIEDLGNDKYNYILADKTKIIRKGDVLLLGLNNGRRIVADYNNNRFENVKFDKYITDLDFFTENQKFIKYNKKISALYIWEFFDKKNNQHIAIRDLKKEFHHRFLWPLVFFVISVLIAAMFINSSFQRVSSSFNNIAYFISSFCLIILYFVFREYFLSRNDLVILLYAYIMLIFSYSLYLIFINNKIFNK
ncbi:MAG: LptF/LptG family permease [Rickettsiales bacterium]|nr:LptF/LptG family permease [Rickettsiales bacterium]